MMQPHLKLDCFHASLMAPSSPFYKQLAIMYSLWAVNMGHVLNAFSCTQPTLRPWTYVQVHAETIETDTVGSSPWTYIYVHRWACSHTSSFRKFRHRAEEGTL